MNDASRNEGESAFCQTLQLKQMSLRFLACVFGRYLLGVVGGLEPESKPKLGLLSLESLETEDEAGVFIVVAHSRIRERYERRSVGEFSSKCCIHQPLEKAVMSSMIKPSTFTSALYSFSSTQIPCLLQGPLHSPTVSGCPTSGVREAALPFQHKPSQCKDYDKCRIVYLNNQFCVSSVSGNV